ncbi:6166_t:CDS:2, partial [Racocetra persica]
KTCPPPKDTPQHYKNKKWIAVLNIIDVASRFKVSVPLISKKSSEVAKVFEKIYDDSNNPLTYLTLLQYDNGKEWAEQTSQLMKEHSVVIRVIGLYSHC